MTLWVPRLSVPAYRPPPVLWAPHAIRHATAESVARQGQRLGLRVDAWTEYAPPPAYVPIWPVLPPPPGHSEYPDYWEDARIRERDRYGSVRHPGLNPWQRQIIQCAVTFDETGIASELTGADATQDTASITVAAGSLLVNTFASFDPGAGSPHLTLTTGCTLDGSTNFTSGIAGQNSGSGDHAVGMWYLPNVGAGSHFARNVFTSAQTDTTLYLSEIIGAATSSVADGAGVSTSGTSTTPASGAFSASASDDAWIGAAMSESATGTPVAGSGWGNLASMTTASHLRSAVEFIMNPGATSENGNFTGFTSAGWAALVFAFKAAAGGGGATTLRMNSRRLLGVGR